GEFTRDRIDSTRISRHLKNIQIGIVSGFAIFRSSTPNKLQRGYSSLLAVRLFSVFCPSAPKASDHTGYRVPTEAARVPIMADLDSGSIVSASGMRREDEWSLATGLALTKYDHGEVYRAKDPSLSRYSFSRRQLQCVFTYSLRWWPVYASIFTTVICGPPPLSFGNNYRTFPLRLTLRHNTGTHHFVSYWFGKPDNAARDVQDRCVYAAASSPIGTGKRRQLFLLIIIGRKSTPPPRAWVGKRLSSRRSGVKPEAGAAPQAIPAIQFLNTSLSPVSILLSNATSPRRNRVDGRQCCNDGELASLRYHGGMSDTIVRRAATGPRNSRIARPPRGLKRNFVAGLRDA
ncbi:hypothetical protein ALC57_17541, partial [Trachymyrmex cornetzi]